MALLPPGGVCVICCTCDALVLVYFTVAGGRVGECSISVGLHPTKLPQSWDTRAAHPGVLACTEPLCKTERECKSTASVRADCCAHELPSVA